MAKTTLLALPCAGASAMMYMRWARKMPANVQLYAAELPGRGTRMGEEFIEEFWSQVDSFCTEYSEQMSGDYVLFGHSMGVLLAYGVAHRQASSQRALPKGLILSACTAPIAQDPERFKNKNTDQALLDDLRRLGGTAEAVLENAELRQMALSTLRADYKVCQSFTYPQDVPSLDVPFCVMAGQDDTISSANIQAWERETSRSVEFNWFKGSHFYIWPQEQAVLKTIMQFLDALAEDK